MADPGTALRTGLADRYRLERELGRGGMARVYLAHDLKHDRPVALKVLHPGLGAALGAERFLREVRTATRLQHPNILPVFGSGAAGPRGGEITRAIGGALRLRLLLPESEARSARRPRTWRPTGCTSRGGTSGTGGPRGTSVPACGTSSRRWSGTRDSRWRTPGWPTPGRCSAMRPRSRHAPPTRPAAAHPQGTTMMDVIPQAGVQLKGGRVPELTVIATSWSSAQGSADGALDSEQPTLRPSSAMHARARRLTEAPPIRPVGSMRGATLPGSHLEDACPVPSGNHHPGAAKRIGAWLIVAGLLIAGPLGAQSEKRVTILATRPVQFASWSSAAMPHQVPGSFPEQLAPLVHRRGRNALIGGAIVTVAGLAFCTVISNLVNDPGSGFSTCTRKGYLLTGGIGLGAGVLIGLIV